MNNVGIIRAPRDGDNPYFSFRRATAQDGLSMEALGVLTYLLSHTSDWRTRPSELQKHFQCGRDRIRKALEELCHKGYLSKVQGRASKGKFAENEYQVHESPFTEKPSTVTPSTVTPSTVTPSTENPQLTQEENLTQEERETQKEREAHSKDKRAAAALLSLTRAREFLNTTEISLASYPDIHPSIVSAPAPNSAPPPTPRPNVFTWYEEATGYSLTAMIADELKLMLTEYSEEWIHDALREMGLGQIKNLKYARAILERWKREGKPQKAAPPPVLALVEKPAPKQPPEEDDVWSEFGLTKAEFRTLWNEEHKAHWLGHAMFISKAQLIGRLRKEKSCAP